MTDLKSITITRIERINADNLIYQIDKFQFNGMLAVSRDTLNVDDVATSELVDDSSGTLITQRNYAYENNRIIGNSIDTNGDGVNDRFEVYNYNPNGTLATTTLSSINDGVISSASYVYEIGNCNRNSSNSAFDYYCIDIE